MSDYLILSTIIYAVDDRYRYQLHSPTATSVLKFLAQHDHEGASISVSLLCRDDMAYKMLDFLASLERPE